MSQAMRVFEARARDQGIGKEDYGQDIYLDDRSYTARQVHQAKSLREVWIGLVADMEGKENSEKAAILAKTCGHDQELEHDPDMKAIAMRTLKLLGVDFLRTFSSLSSSSSS